MIDVCLCMCKSGCGNASISALIDIENSVCGLVIVSGPQLTIVRCLFL